MPKILVVEDNHNIRENIEELLSLLGFNVCTAPNGKKGVESIKTEKPDLILCDVHMPLMNGYEVLEYAKSDVKTAKIPFVFITSSSQQKDIDKGALSGADSYLIKPFQMEELQETISKLLGENINN